VYVEFMYALVGLNICFIQLMARLACCRSFLECGATMASLEAWQRQDPLAGCQDDIFGAISTNGVPAVF
jgi:hypothetical protein